MRRLLTASAPRAAHPASGGRLPLRIGPVRVLVEGDDVVAQRLHTELRDCYAEHDGAPHLTLRIGGQSEGLGKPISSQAGRRFPYRFKTVIHEVGVSFEMSARFGKPLYTIDLDVPPLQSGSAIHAELQVPLSRPSIARSLADPLIRTLTRDFSGSAEVFAKNLLYEAVDPLVWCAMLPHGASFVHAGAVATGDGHGLLLMGTGGVGKTTTVLEMVLNRGFRYLADDLVVVSPDGLSRYPKHLQLYAYNSALVSGVEERILRGRAPVDRALWHIRRRLLGDSQVRRRVAASDFFGRDAVAQNVALSAAVLLTTSLDDTGVVVESADRTQLARQAASVICDEFWDFTRFLNSLSTISSEAATLGTLHELVTATIEPNLPVDDCYLVRVPPRTSGTELAEVLTSQVPLR